MLSVVSIDKGGGHTDGMHARPDCSCCAETPTDGAAAFSAARIIPAEAGTENSEIPSASSGGHQSVISDVYYAALLRRRGPHNASHSVCLSVCLSVRPSRSRK